MNHKLKLNKETLYRLDWTPLHHVVGGMPIDFSDGMAVCQLTVNLCGGESVLNPCLPGMTTTKPQCGHPATTVKDTTKA